ncbi:MAG: cation diffusion facilitator family transporter [Candidatus Obscuribacterales bacterium]|nr:cation diffusion facilitator family transporter [Candidatus Obscuribacterales bacterium]
MNQRFRDPIFVMGLVALMYVVKAVLKITVGQMINSPMIAGDGFHNIADLFEAAAVITVIVVARRPSTVDYPFGRKNIEFFASLAIGASLLYMSFQFTVESLVGLLAMKPALDEIVRGYVSLPAYQPLVMSTKTLPWVLAVTAGSTALSVIVSRYQISVGRSSGHASLVADGEETASDGRIEAVTFVGVIAEYLFHAPWLEYPLGLVVAVLIGRTGFELFRSAWRVLLQHSLGEERESKIKEICLATPGIMGIFKLKTFQVGHTAVCLIDLETQRGHAAVIQIQYGIEYHLRQYLEEEGFKEFEFKLDFHLPLAKRHRVAYAIKKVDGKSFISPTLSQASHIWVCDIERGKVMRSTEEVLPENPLALLLRKHAFHLYVFDSAKENADSLEAVGIELHEAVSYLPELLGLHLEF